MKNNFCNALATMSILAPKHFKWDLFVLILFFVGRREGNLMVRKSQFYNFCFQFRFGKLTNGILYDGIYITIHTTCNAWLVP